MRTALLVALLSSTSVSLPMQPGATELQARLDARVSQYNLSANGLADALAKTAKKFQLPIGIEWVRDKQALQGLSRTWKDDTVRQVLGSIVEAYPGYAFRVEDGVVHVFRRDLVNDSHSFLNLKVPDFFEVRQEAAGFANVRLRSVVQNIVSPRNLPPGAGEGGSYASGNVPEKPVTLTLRGATVREALEKMAAVSERNIWVVTFSDTPGLTPTGFRRTETLWHPAPFPDTEQPMWDFLAWGEYAPESTRPATHPTRAPAKCSLIRAGQFAQMNFGACSTVCLVNNARVRGGQANVDQIVHVGSYPIRAACLLLSRPNVLVNGQ